ncbi:hypothetical protein JHK82_023781 [Glycine max]|uniref:Uncharacterized protein n=1 Tax=Glycine soja TaxID=3848 RepID=A0A445IVY2_GLYSO|nr:hypothetical protein JHK86_023848 [Glycine max]KAG5132593.1 hypothetical protein JHK82_023781 [Glycine max]KAH1041125.1 hypothetical protein GYH30_023783 [Glycine max]RZB90236.1 hypothetical protein D0Y65_022942 [Glycine soja]
MIFNHSSPPPSSSSLEMPLQEVFMQMMESAESIKSWYWLPTSCQSSSFLSLIFFHVSASIFQISMMGFKQKMNSMSWFPKVEMWCLLASDEATRMGDDTQYVYEQNIVTIFKGHYS